jgi:hypothetical protein
MQTDFIDGAIITAAVVAERAHPPVDSLQEFKVQSNNYAAIPAVRRVVNATIKSGTKLLARLTISGETGG